MPGRPCGRAFRRRERWPDREVTHRCPERTPEWIFHAQYQPVIPLGRSQTPEDIGKMAAFLDSEDARNVTGECIHVDE